MKKTISIGAQNFGKLREKDCFYIDKTSFIKEWWEHQDDVTLITRPRRFGKTLNMSMLECFFSNKYAGRGEELFGDLQVWQNEELRAEQGQWPVIFLSFAGIKATSFDVTRTMMNGLIANIFDDWRDRLDYDHFDTRTRNKYDAVCEEMNDATAALSLNTLCGFLERHYGKKPIILLDEYDTPMQEAWVSGYWDELVQYIRVLFNNTFKTNPHLERAVMTGITRVSKESIFSDLNNLTVVTTTSEAYRTSFGFTEEEVFAAMDAQGFDPSLKEEVKYWYDGFIFGSTTDIYNPWSVTSFLENGKLDTWWADTSGNGLVSELIRTGSPGLKEDFEELLKGNSLKTVIDEQIVFSGLKGSPEAVWSLLVASGYLKITDTLIKKDGLERTLSHVITITNYETRLMFSKLIRGWFAKAENNYPKFIRCMLTGNVEDMNNYMTRITRDTFSSFDTGTHPSEKEPERFYHGFVLGLMVDKASGYVIRSNRESGFGRYDVVMEPKDTKDVAVILEFKVFNADKGEKDLSDTIANALKQIEDKRYDADLLARGIPAERIYKYGFAFRGSECRIGIA
ncbi:MAG: AAA family ATPase [Lachnospiraceae bacterium]|nr:AAA family ATPase [Lachnospiraceae bacterium]